MLSQGLLKIPWSLEPSTQWDLTGHRSNCGNSTSPLNSKLFVRKILNNLLPTAARLHSMAMASSPCCPPLPLAPRNHRPAIKSPHTHGLNSQWKLMTLQQGTHSNNGSGPTTSKISWHLGIIVCCFTWKMRNEHLSIQLPINPSAIKQRATQTIFEFNVANILRH